MWHVDQEWGTLEMVQQQQQGAREDQDVVHHLMESQEGISEKGGTMRLGAYECRLAKGTLAHRLYGESVISERHRHRFEFNNAYRDQFGEAGLVPGGLHPELDLVEIVEIPSHPFFIGVQFHPEFKSSPLSPHPIFRGFVAAALAHARGDSTRQNDGLLQGSRA